MPESTESQQFESKLPWYAAAILAVLALLGGILLGRVAFQPDSSIHHDSIDPALVSDDYTGAARLEYLEENGVLIVHFTDLPKLEEDEVYQVWMMQGSRSTSVGVLPPGATRWAFAGDPNVTQTVLITVEPDPTGSEHPTTDPLVRFDLVDFKEED